MVGTTSLSHHAIHLGGRKPCARWCTDNFFATSKVGGGCCSCVAAACAMRAHRVHAVLSAACTGRVRAPPGWGFGARASSVGVERGLTAVGTAVGTAVEHASANTLVQAHGPIVYQLPQERIASHPLDDRAASKLMVTTPSPPVRVVCAPSERPRGHI